MNESTLDCGREISSDEKYLKILENSGDELASSDSIKALAFFKRKRPLELEVTKKGCVIYSDDIQKKSDHITISRIDDSLSQGTVVDFSKSSNFIKLEKISSLPNEFKCDGNLYSNKELNLPQKYANFHEDRYRWYASIENYTVELEKSTSIFFPIDFLDDGEHTVDFAVEDTFLNQKRTFSCKLIVDRIRPLIDIEKTTIISNTLNVEGDKIYNFLVTETSPFIITYCIIVSGKCNWIEGEKNFRTPADGKWEMNFFVTDSAGNISEKYSTTLSIFKRTPRLDLTSLFPSAVWPYNEKPSSGTPFRKELKRCFGLPAHLTIEGNEGVIRTEGTISIQDLRAPGQDCEVELYLPKPISKRFTSGAYRLKFDVDRLTAPHDVKISAQIVTVSGDLITPCDSSEVGHLSNYGHIMNCTIFGGRDLDTWVLTEFKKTEQMICQNEISKIVYKFNLMQNAGTPIQNYSVTELRFFIPGILSCDSTSL
ncbi:MAG: hypothetical protein EOP07_03930 [Proteobacteria bacterium]|nr:MAG: hypothetical protein EOP07_03930 [Pseudomonadota bacterium]